MNATFSPVHLYTQPNESVHPGEFFLNKNENCYEICIKGCRSFRDAMYLIRILNKREEKTVLTKFASRI